MKHSNKQVLKLTALILFLLIISISQACEAYGLGVAPSRKIVDYAPEISAAGTVVNNEHKDMNIVIYAEGEYAQYISIGQPYMTLSSAEPEKKFDYKVKLPGNTTPGGHIIRVIIMELPDKTGGQTNIVSALSIEQELIVNIPYPGKFAEGVLFIDTKNVEKVTFTANIISRGSQEISNIHGAVVIKGPLNDELYRLKSNTIESIPSKQSNTLTAQLDKPLNPGVYYAEFIVNYDEQQFVIRKSFIIGDMSIEINDMTFNDFRLGYIVRTDLELLNRWNQPLEVYADIKILDDEGIRVSEFKTASAEAKQLSTTVLSGYWDTKGLSVGEYNILVALHFGGKAVEKAFKTVIGIDQVSIQGLSTAMVVEKPETVGGGIPLLYILVIGLIMVNMFFAFVYFKYIKKKDEQQ